MLTPIICCVDDAYCPQLSALLRSIAASNKRILDDLRVVILGLDLTIAHKAALTALADRLKLMVELRETPAVDPRWPVSGWVSQAVYARLAIPEVAGDYSKVLYLDADTLVLDELTDLLEADMRGYPVAAIQDSQHPVIGSGIAMPAWRELGLERGQRYFNSGVMLLDIESCICEGIMRRAADLCRTNPEAIRFWDQDALNYSARGRWLALDARWNTLAMSPLVALPDFIHSAETAGFSVSELVDREPHASILHFSGPHKPWLASYPAGAVRNLYRKYFEPVA